MDLYENLVEQAELNKIPYQTAVKRMMEYYQQINNKRKKK